MLQERFPEAFGRQWCHCHNCKPDADTCKNRTKIDLENRSYYHCNKQFLYFHDPNFDDVKVLYELYKLEKNITSY